MVNENDKSKQLELYGIDSKSKALQTMKIMRLVIAGIAVAIGIAWGMFKRN